MQQPCIASVTKTAPQVDDLVVYNSSVSCFPQWLYAVANSSIEQYTSPGVSRVILENAEPANFLGICFAIMQRESCMPGLQHEMEEPAFYTLPSCQMV